MYATISLNKTLRFRNTFMKFYIYVQKFSTHTIYIMHIHTHMQTDTLWKKTCTNDKCI